MGFPSGLTSERQWLIRSKQWSGKLKKPISGLSDRPIDYEPEPGESPYYWRFNWDDSSVWMTYAQAVAWVSAHPEDAIDSGLSFVLHPGKDYSPKRRIVLIDFDRAIGDDGEVDPAALAIIDLIGGWVEFSRSGRGLHLFVFVEECPAFVSQTGIRLGGCKYDVLLSYQAAVTGNTFQDGDVPTVSVDFLRQLPGFNFRLKTDDKEIDLGAGWEDDPLSEVPEEWEYLIPAMEDVPAIEGLGGQKVLFASACNLMREGVPFRAAEVLLGHVPAVPPFAPHEIQRIINCAYKRTMSDGDYGIRTPAAWDDLPVVEHELTPVPPPPKPEAGSDEDRYGFKVYRGDLLEDMDLTIEWLVENAFVEGGALFIGGREKTFKTSVALDLLVSLAGRGSFLGRFAALERRSSVLFTAEIGIARARVLQTSIRRAKGIPKSDLDVLDIVENVPRFNLAPKGRIADKDTLAAFKKLRLYLHERRPQVAVFDPLYLALGGVEVGNMYEIGEVLKKVTETCREFGTMPIFCHHAMKDKTKEGRPMDLTDFYGSGIGAYARQWLLLSHAEPFRGGVAKLYGNIGGSAQGSRGIWRIEIDEGRPDDIMDRQWEVTVREETDTSGAPDILSTLAHQQMKLGDLATVMEMPKELLKTQLNALIRSGAITLSDGFYQQKGL